MSSAGAQSNHINHVTTQMQYAAVVAVVCIIGYIIAGLVQIWWVALGISLMLLLAVLTFIKKRGRGSNRENDSRYIRIRTEAQKQRKEQARKPAPS